MARGSESFRAIRLGDSLCDAFNVSLTGILSCAFGEVWTVRGGNVGVDDFCTSPRTVAITEELVLIGEGIFRLEWVEFSVSLPDNG